MKLTLSVQEQQNRSQQLQKMTQVDRAQEILDAKQSNYKLQQYEKQAQLEQAKNIISANQTAYELIKTLLEQDKAEVQRYRQLLKEGVVP